MPDSTPGPALVSMAQQFTGLPMTSLIGGPLMAAAQANQQMALTQVQFLMSTCFNKGSGSGGGGSGSSSSSAYTPVMIDLEITRGVLTPPVLPATETTIQLVKTTISLPMLTIVPLNSLAVDNVSVQFDMEVSSTYSQDSSSTSTDTTHEEGSFDAKIGFALWSVEIKGSVSHDSSNTNTNSSHYQKSNSAKYSVNVHAGQLPLPPGVQTIIQAFASAISPIMMPTPAKAA